MDDLLINLLASLIFAAMAFAAGWSLKRLKDWQALAHVARFVGDHDCIKIVVSGSRVARFTIVRGGQHHEATVPANVLSMGMSEGQAVGELIRDIHRARQNIRILIVPSAHFDDDGIPFICVGGPSVNSITRRYLEKFFPSFHMQYPEHVAGWLGNLTYRPTMDGEELCEDFGFLFYGVERETKFLLAFGIWPFGTLIAVRSFLSAARKSAIYNGTAQSHFLSLISRADISRYFLGHFSTVETKRWDNHNAP